MLAVLPRTILNNRMKLQQDDLKEKNEFILFFKIGLGKIASAARNLINSSLLPKLQQRPISALILLL